MSEEKKVKIFKFPTYQEYLKSINATEGEDKNYDKTEFVRDWADTTIDGWIWDMCSDYTSESLSEDESIWALRQKDIDLYLIVARNHLEGMKLSVKERMTDEEVFGRMIPEEKEEYIRLRKEYDEIRLVNEL